MAHPSRAVRDDCRRRGGRKGVLRQHAEYRSPDPTRDVFREPRAAGWVGRGAQGQQERWGGLGVVLKAQPAATLP